MSVTFSPGTDFEDVVDGLEAVTLDRRGKSNTSITNALQRQVTTHEIAASDGKYTAGDCRWHFPVSESSAQPASGDVLIDSASDRWTVIDVRLATLGDRWVCVCRNIAVLNGLSSFISIEKATWAKGTGGAAEAGYSTWRTGIRARIQPLDTDITTEQGSKYTAKKYRIFIDDDLELGHNHRVCGPDGTLYKIDGTTGRETIGGVQIIEASAWRN